MLRMYLRDGRSETLAHLEMCTECRPIAIRTRVEDCGGFLRNEWMPCRRSLSRMIGLVFVRSVVNVER